MMIENHNDEVAVVWLGRVDVVPGFIDAGAFAFDTVGAIIALEMEDVAQAREVENGDMVAAHLAKVTPCELVDPLMNTNQVPRLVSKGCSTVHISYSIADFGVVESLLGVCFGEIFDPR
jgi:hypothetical protein